jgi:hypothetical protein
MPMEAMHDYIYIVRIPPIRKKHTDRVFLSSACEPLDQGCVSFEGL